MIEATNVEEGVLKTKYAVSKSRSLKMLLI